MKAIVNKSVLKGTVRAIASKSYAHRALIAAALADVDTKVICEETSDDILATISCLKSLGARIIDIENGYMQELGEHEEEYVPTFDLNGI